MAEILDIKIDGIKKQKIRINGDDSKILELNTSDMKFMERLAEVKPQLETLSEKEQELSTTIKNLKSVDVNEDVQKTFDTIESFTAALKDIDKEMRNLVDYMFDSNVSEVCCSGMSMYDMSNGKFLYEIIIDTLSDLYKNNIETETLRVKQRINQHTAKYTNKPKNRQNRQNKRNR